MKLLYSLKNIDLKYPRGDSSAVDDDIPALAGLTLDIYENEYLIILGPNGSGKSSLGRLLAGIADDMSGELFYRGQKVKEYKRDLFKDTAMVLQEPQNQLLMPTVGEELAFPLENMGLNPQAIKAKVERAALSFGLEKLLNKNPDDLSGGQSTALALAGALIADPQTIILDEPDSHLDSLTRKTLDNFISQYRHRRTIILITQYPQLAQNADRVIVLDKGKLVAQGPPSKILTDDPLLERNKLNKSLKARPLGKGPLSISGAVKDSLLLNDSQAFITFRHVYFSYDNKNDVLRNINFRLCAGQRVALIGPSGSGKTTFGLILAGLLKPDRGEVRINGELLFLQKARPRHVSMAIQFPERALFEETVQDDVAFGPKNMGHDDVGSIVEKYLCLFGIKGLAERSPFSLSGGEKRKVALAGVMATEAKTIIFDEPSASLDPASTDELIKLINACEDKTFVIISHDLDFIAATCSRVIGLKTGSIIFDLAADEFFSDTQNLKKLDLVIR